jgi:hypothetical protein
MQRAAPLAGEGRVAQPSDSVRRFAEGKHAATDGAVGKTDRCCLVAGCHPRKVRRDDATGNAANANGEKHPSSGGGMGGEVVTIREPLDAVNE